MVTVLGENTLESVAVTCVAEPLLPHELAGAVELPPQAVVTTSAIPRASMVRMRSLLGRSERCMAEDVTRLGPVTDLCKARTLRRALADSGRLEPLVIVVTRIPVSSRNGVCRSDGAHPTAIASFRTMTPTLAALSAPYSY